MKFTLPSYSAADLALPMPAFDPVTAIMEKIKADATTAITKTRVEDLSEDEKFALAYYARVPMQSRDMREGDASHFRLTTVPCSMFHDGGKWVVVMRAEDER